MCVSGGRRSRGVFVKNRGKRRGYSVAAAKTTTSATTYKQHQTTTMKSTPPSTCAMIEANHISSETAHFRNLRPPPKKNNFRAGKNLLPDEISYGLRIIESSVKTTKKNADDCGLRSLALQKPFQKKSAFSTVPCVHHHHGHHHHHHHHQQEP